MHQQQGQRHRQLHGDYQPRDVASEQHGHSDSRISEFGSQIPTMPGQAGRSNLTTPFDGDHKGGILELRTSNFADDNGPPLHLKEEAIATGSPTRVFAQKGAGVRAPGERRQLSPGVRGI
jgi:hypothetical protein